MALHSPTAPRTPRCSSPGRRAPGATPGATTPGPRHRNTRRQLSPEQRQFAVSHLNLAKQQARRFANRHGIPYDDLLGAAYEGLCKAALGFDASLGHRPSSYVVPKVKGELLHHLRDTGFLLRITHRMRELWMKARRPVALGLADGEIAALLGIELPEWLEVRQACGLRPVPLEEEGE
jgi:RNA polymerase sigma-B factor